MGNFKVGTTIPKNKSSPASMDGWQMKGLRWVDATGAKLLLTSGGEMQSTPVTAATAMRVTAHRAQDIRLILQRRPSRESAELYEAVCDPILDLNVFVTFV
jgi:hypothetical protein